MQQVTQIPRWTFAWSVTASFWWMISSHVTVSFLQIPHWLVFFFFFLFFSNLQESKMFSASSAPFWQSTRFCSTPPVTRGSGRHVEPWKPSCSHLSTGKCVFDSVAQQNLVTFHQRSCQVSRLWWLWVVIHTVNCCFQFWKRGYHLDWNAVLHHCLNVI